MYAYVWLWVFFNYCFAGISEYNKCCINVPCKNVSVKCVCNIHNVSPFDLSGLENLLVDNGLRLIV